jgi:hypothetical protein
MMLSRRESGLLRDRRNSFYRVRHPQYRPWEHKYQKLQEYVGLVCERSEVPPSEYWNDRQTALGTQIATLESARFEGI